MSLGQKFQLRNAQQFFDTQSFKAPRDLGDVSKRLSSNIDYFQANYSILVAIVLAYVCYHDHYVLFTSLLLGGVGFWLFSVRKNPIVISGRTFTDQELLIAFAVGSATLLSYMGGTFLTYSLAFAGLLILIHAGMKETGFGQRATNALNDAANKMQ